MNPNKALWEKGDFTRIAEAMRESGAGVVRSLGIGPGQAVLDLGCGDGTTAVPAAQLGANVLGVDIASNLVAAGQARAASLGLENLRFQEGDASDLAGIADKSFDRVISFFGAMFAPKPDQVAREIVRVTKPGGQIVMGNWIPGDPSLIAQVLKISSAYTPPPPPGFVSPMTWGNEDMVAGRFADAGLQRSAVSCLRDIYTFRYPGPPSGFLDLFRHYYGPIMNAYEAAEASGRGEALHGELSTLFERENTSSDRAKTEISATFLRVTVNV